MSIRILFFVGVYLPRTGGVPINTHKMILSLINKGVDVRVFAPHEKGDTDIKIPYMVYRYHRSPIKHFLSRSHIWGLYNIKRSWNFDIIHCHGIDPAGYCSAFFKRLTAIPYVLTLRKSDIFKEERHFFHKRRNKRAKIALVNADKITAISSKIFDILVDGGINPSRIIKIPHGIDPSPYELAKPIKWPRPYILSVGRLVKFKGFDLLIKAFYEVSQLYPSLDLIIIGKGPKEPELKEIINKLNLTDKVHLVGEKRGEEKYAFYKGALFYVFPSYPGREGFPNVILEAMSANLPIIATRVSGAEDVVIDGVTGYLIPPNDKNMLVTRMLYLLTNPDKIKPYRIKQALEKYKLETIISLYIDVYKSCLFKKI